MYRECICNKAQQTLRPFLFNANFLTIKTAKMHVKITTKTARAVASELRATRVYVTNRISIDKINKIKSKRASIDEKAMHCIARAQKGEQS
jgi:hypothetical protein